MRNGGFTVSSTQYHVYLDDEPPRKLYGSLIEAKSGVVELYILAKRPVEIVAVNTPPGTRDTKWIYDYSISDWVSLQL